MKTTKLLKAICIGLAVFFIGNASAITGAYDAGFGLAIPLPPGEWRLLSDKPNPDHNWYGHQIRAGRALVLGRPEGDKSNIAGILIRYHKSELADTFRFPDPSCYTNVELGLSNFYGTASSNIWNKCSGLWWHGKAYSPMDFLTRVREAQGRLKNPLPSHPSGYWGAVEEGFRKLPDEPLLAADVNVRFHKQDVHLIIFIRPPSLAERKPTSFSQQVAISDSPRAVVGLSKWLASYIESLERAISKQKPASEITGLDLGDTSTQVSSAQIKYEEVMEEINTPQDIAPGYRERDQAASAKKPIAKVPTLPAVKPVTELEQLKAEAQQERREKVKLEAQLLAAQKPTQPPLKIAPQGKRVALVIGNAKYKFSPLNNPVNDATDMAASLRSVGFDVIEVKDATLKQMRAATRQFADKLEVSDVGLVYYSGHGIEVKGKNYLIPVNADIRREYEVVDQAFDASNLLRMMESLQSGTKKRVNILIVDACRNNDLPKSWRSTNNGLARMDAPAGSFISFATAPGQVAADGQGRNSPYTKHLLQALKQPNVPIEQVFKQVRRNVMAETSGEQVPWENSSLVGDFYFTVAR